jgi:CelD/BcsL family acetyltransferase involved in cellulose biosynthesis
MINIRLVGGKDLTAELAAQWSAVRRGQRKFDSPFFAPEFIAAVAAVRDDVEVAVLEEQGQPVGFFPFQRASQRVAQPVGGRLSDFQGVICGAEAPWSAGELLRGCGLHRWHFDHLVCSPPLQPYCLATRPSSYMDLTGGFEAYREACRGRGSHQVREGLRKARAVQRDLGPLRFVPHTADPRVFAQLVDWKRAQYRRTGQTDVFAFSWTTALLERLMEERTEAFAGMLSALYIGDRLAAAHFGMRSQGVLHAWFPAYNRELAAYYPGRLLFVECARAAESLRISRIDLGAAPSQFKAGLMSATIEVGEGCVDLSPAKRQLRQLWWTVRRRLRLPPLRTVLRRPYRLLQRAHGPVDLR